MKECFIPKRFNSKFSGLIPKVEEIMESYSSQGYDLTVRQLYYQLVARNIIPNNMKSYKMIVGLLTDARYAGLLDWGDLVDRNRIARRAANWDDIPAFLEDVRHEFQLNKWKDQPYHVEVMVEKDALSGIVGPVCQELDIAYTANKGYTSSSAIYRAGKRLRSYHDKGKKIVLMYLGDHDPSGIDMTTDVTERVRLLAGNPCGVYGEKLISMGSVPLDSIKIQRLALNIDQVRRLNPPENPAKDSDSRTPAYVEAYGDKCWELDAVEPNALAEIIRKAVLKLRVADLWDAAVAKENALKAELEKLAKNYGKKRKRK